MSGQTIAAVGAGRMGRGIAVTFAMAGHTVHIIDLKQRPQSEQEALRIASLGEIRSTLAMLADIGMFDPAECNAMVQNIRFSGRNECTAALAKSDILFEAVPETLEAKTEALQIISRQADQHAIIASTTSTILSDELQPLVTGAGRFLNAHWLNPAFLVPLVELSPGSETAPETTGTMKTVLESIGKVPVVCKPSPGYIVPRIQMLAMNEAARMVEEGVASVDDIDKATKYGFGFRFAILGMLEFIDWGGGDILFHASNYMTGATGDERYSAPGIIKSNMAEGKIGLSTKKGFLDYDSMDVPAYQRDRLAAMVAMLRHLDLLPKRT